MGRIIFILLLKVFLLPLLPCISGAPSSPSTTERRALFVIDMQGCFLDKCGSVPAGSLAVGNSHAIIPTIAGFHKWGKASGYMDFAIFSADAHPPDNISFAENHISDDDDDISSNSRDATTARSLERELRPRKPFEKINLVCNLGAFGLGTHDEEKAAVTNDERPKCCVFKKGSTTVCRCELDATTGAVKHPDQCRIIEQTLWPRHCVVKDGDHVISSFLTPEPGVDAIVEKGTEVDLDSYSAVFPNLNLTRAEILRAGEEKREKSYILPPYKLLRDRGIREVFITGVATDFCVRSTAHDLHSLGFDVTVIRDAVRGVFPHANGDAYFEHTFKQQGIKVKTAEEVVAGSGSDVRMEKILELDCGKHKSTFLWPFMFLLGYLWF